VNVISYLLQCVLLLYFSVVIVETQLIIISEMSTDFVREALDLFNDDLHGEGTNAVHHIHVFK